MNRRKTILAAAALAAITVLVYLPAMRNGFVWDDREMAIDNPLVKSAGGLGEIWLGKKLPEYHPLTYSVFWLEWRLWGANPAGWHVINIFLHAGGRGAALAGAAEIACAGKLAGGAAVWRASGLRGVGGVDRGAEEHAFDVVLSGRAAFLFAVRGGGGTADRRWYGAALGAFALALLAKVSVVVLPVVLLLIAWWRRGGITRREFARTVPFFLLAAAAGLYGMTFQNRYTGLNDALPERLLGGSWAVWFYLWKILWPVHLTVIYPRWRLSAATAADWIPAACFAAMVFVFWRNRRGWGRACLFGVGYFVIALAPVLGVFKMAFLDFSQVADHLQYLAAPGIIALVVAGGWRWLPKDWGRLAGVVVVVMFSALTLRNEGRYADMGAFWRENLASNPNSFQAMIYVGSEMDKEKRYAEAEVLFKRVLAMRPDSLEGNYNMGVLLDDEGRVDEAMGFEEKALRIKPDQADAHILLAWCLAEKGRGR